MFSYCPFYCRKWKWFFFALTSKDINVLKTKKSIIPQDRDVTGGTQDITGFHDDRRHLHEHRHHPRIQPADQRLAEPLRFRLLGSILRSNWLP